MDAPSSTTKWRRTLAIALILLLVGSWIYVGWRIYGYYRPSPNVVLVFPSEFRGLAKVCASDEGPRLLSDGIEEIRFDMAGRAVNGNAKPLIKWSHLYAQFDDGTRLPLWDTDYRRPAADESVGVWQGGGPSSGNDCIYFYVGSPTDAEAFNRAFLRDAFGEAGELLMPRGR